jgi:hypothetical protein
VERGLFNLLSSPQQDISNKEKNEGSSDSNDDYYNKQKKMKIELLSHKEEEGEGEGGGGIDKVKGDSKKKLGRDLFLQTRQDISDFDSLQEQEKIAIDYMAKDYASFRHALIDLIPRKIPQWKDRSEADMGIMLIELFSYVADELSYSQDRVANEAFLRSARARSSVSNHLQLIDYHIQNGLSANAFIKVEIKKSSAIIPAGFQVSTPPEKGEEGRATIIVETLEDQLVNVEWNKIPVERIKKEDSNNDSSSGTIHLSAILERSNVELKRGQHLLLFQEDPLTGDITKKTIVKLSEDSKVFTGQGGSNSNNYNNNNILITWEKGDESPESPYGWNMERVFCCTNILRASHGRTIRSEILKEKDQKVSKYSFSLKEAPLTFNSVDSTSGIQARSTLKVWVDGELWEETESLLDCGPFDKKFSISIDEDGYATIFFGNSKSGLKPEVDSLIEAQYRVGNGSVGNVAAGTLTQYDLLQNPRWLVEEVIGSVTNPLPATGGIDIESIEDAKIAGPKSLKALQRAVTLRDYEDLVKREFQNEITNARARFVYTGSWDTIFVSVDVKGGRKNIVVNGDDRDNDSGLSDRIRKYLNKVKMIGSEVQIEEAQHVPIEIRITVCLQKYLDTQVVRGRILSSLSSKDNMVDGTKGLFHPDNFTFGDPVYASKIYEVLKKTPEVKYAIITTFRKRDNEENVNRINAGNPSAAPSSVSSPSPSSSSEITFSERSIADRDEETKRNLEIGYIPIFENEIITIDSDPMHPENGILIINFVGDDIIKNHDDDDYQDYPLSDYNLS